MWAFESQQNRNLVSTPRVSGRHYWHRASKFAGQLECEVPREVTTKVKDPDSRRAHLLDGSIIKPDKLSLAFPELLDSQEAKAFPRSVDRVGVVSRDWWP